MRVGGEVIKRGGGVLAYYFNFGHSKSWQGMAGEQAFMRVWGGTGLPTYFFPTSKAN